ncbi:MAG: carboxypeptidase regulatory-like domain-containing protein [bacterium]
MRCFKSPAAIIIIILVALFALSGCGSPGIGTASLPDVSPPQTPDISLPSFTADVSEQEPTITSFSDFGTISGKLVSEDGPLGGVTVSTLFGESAITNADGSFTISSVPPGTATLILPEAPYDLNCPEVTVTKGRTVSLGEIQALKSPDRAPSEGNCDIEIYAYGLTDVLSWYGDYRVNCFPVEVKMEGLRGSNYADYHYFSGSSTMDYFTFHEVPVPPDNDINSSYRYKITVRYQAHYFDDNGLNKEQSFEIRRYGTVYKNFAGHALRGRVYLRSWDIPSAP